MLRLGSWLFMQFLLLAVISSAAVVYAVSVVNHPALDLGDLRFALLVGLAPTLVVFIGILSVFFLPQPVMNAIKSSRDARRGLQEVEESIEAKERILEELEAETSDRIKSIEREIGELVEGVEEERADVFYECEPFNRERWSERLEGFRSEIRNRIDEIREVVARAKEVGRQLSSLSGTLQAYCRIACIAAPLVSLVAILGVVVLAWLSRMPGVGQAFYFYSAALAMDGNPFTSPRFYTILLSLVAIAGALVFIQNLFVERIRLEVLAGPLEAAKKGLEEVEAKLGELCSFWGDFVGRLSGECSSCKGYLEDLNRRVETNCQGLPFSLSVCSGRGVEVRTQPA